MEANIVRRRSSSSAATARVARALARPRDRLGRRPYTETRGESGTVDSRTDTDDPCLPPNPRRVASPRATRAARVRGAIMMTRCAHKVASCSSRATTTTTRRGAAVVARGKKKGFLFGEVENLSREGDGAKSDDEDAKSVRWSEPLAIAKYPAKCLRAKNAPVETFDKNLERLSKAMFKIMYETVGCGLAAPQVGVNYRMMVYNEAGEPGQGREVVLCNPQIVKFSKEKDLFEEGCLSFPKMYADVEVRIERRRRARLSRNARDERADDDQNINIR